MIQSLWIVSFQGVETTNTMTTDSGFLLYYEMMQNLKNLNIQLRKIIPR